ncbi:MAG: hypothetical protein OXI96_04465 [Acidimicrobiaceae bacterium]|nr:hypothetical protein [Acidimicrobiaceae bacterium]
MVERYEWVGLVARQSVSRDSTTPTIALPFQQSPRGASGTFLAADEDGCKWWVKPLNNAQGQRVVVTSGWCRGSR